MKPCSAKHDFNTVQCSQRRIKRHCKGVYRLSLVRDRLTIILWHPWPDLFHRVKVNIGWTSALRRRRIWPDQPIAMRICWLLYLLLLPNRLLTVFHGCTVHLHTNSKILLPHTKQQPCAERHALLPCRPCCCTGG